MDDAAVGVCGAGDSGTDAIDEDSCDGDDSVGGGDGFDGCVGDGFGDGFGDGALDVGALDGWPPPVCVGVVAVTAEPGRVVAEEGAGNRVRVGVGAPGSREGDSEGDREADTVGEREADNDGGLIDLSPVWPPLPPHADRRPSTRAHPAADWRTRLSIGHLPISWHSIRTAHCVCETSRVTSPTAGDSAGSTVARRGRRHRRHHAMPVRRPRRGSPLRDGVALEEQRLRECHPLGLYYADQLDDLGLLTRSTGTRWRSWPDS